MPKLTISETFVLETSSDKATDSESWDFPDFAEASYAAYKDVHSTMDFRLGFMILSQWFKHDGSESFSVSVPNNHGGEITYAYAI